MKDQKLIKSNIGSLILIPSNGVQSKIVNFSKNLIDTSELHQCGYETNPHVTVASGFESGFDFTKITKYIAGVNNFTVHTSNIGYLENDEEDCDTIILRCDSNIALKVVNTMLRKKFNIIPKVPRYSAYIKLGYVKRGLGNKYVDSIKQKNIVLKNYVYIDGFGQQYSFDNRYCNWKHIIS